VSIIHLSLSYCGAAKQMGRRILSYQHFILLGLSTLFDEWRAIAAAVASGGGLHRRNGRFP
jgi:hypothetical protein